MKPFKRFICSFTAALLLCSALTGCAQGDAGDSAVPGISESGSTDLSAEKAAAADNLVAYEVPERFTGSWSGLEESLFVSADAEIILPDVGTLPTARVERRTFTQAEADRMIEVFMQGNELYKNPVTTKQEYEKIIARWEAALRGEIPYEGDGTIERLPELITQAKECMEAAPNEGERFPAETSFHPEVLPAWAVGGDADAQLIEGYAEVGGREIYCAMRNSGGSSDDYARFWDAEYGDINGIDTISQMQLGDSITPTVSEAQARAMGDSLMAELGLDSFVCDSAEAVRYIREIYSVDYQSEEEAEAAIAEAEAGYLLEYVRQIGGVSLGCTGLNGDASEDGVADIGTWAYERIEVYVTADKVVWFSWTNPYTEPEILEESAALMSFSDVQDIFAKMIFVKNHNMLEANRVNGFETIHSMNIDKVRLTLMRVRDKDSLSEGTIIPVWDFYGTSSARAGDAQHSAYVSDELHYGVVLTVSAIDGTIVDRELGY